MLYTAPMSKPARKPRLPEPVGLAIAIVERVTGEKLVERPKTEVKVKGKRSARSRTQTREPMNDKPISEDFGSSSALLKEIQERSDDIEKAVILPPGYSLSRDGKQTSKPFPTFLLMLFFVNGDRKIMHGDDGEMVLNDGILNRMRIRIEFAKGEVG